MRAGATLKALKRLVGRERCCVNANELGLFATIQLVAVLNDVDALNCLIFLDYGLHSFTCTSRSFSPTPKPLVARLQSRASGSHLETRTAGQ